MPEPEPKPDTPPGPVPQDFLSPLAEGASSLHELQSTYAAAGFSEAQAVYLLMALMSPNRPLLPPS